MPSNPRFIMLGGFLGAGKTTTIGLLARHYQALGKRVAIVTNDQATDLVDTNLLRSQGFDVGEVAGSCFCCNFNELTATMERLGVDQRPEILIAEPVGSCTDLVATVIRPLQQIYSQPFDIAPFGVIIKPSHGMKILRQSGKGGFSPQAEYIFRKQLEEADFVIINRIDELTENTIGELSQLIEVNFPGMPIVRMSAISKQGFDSLCSFLDQEGLFGQKVMDVDYDIYAEGEAELGWLNAQVSVSSTKPYAIDELLLAIVESMNRALLAQNAEVAHLKAIGMSEGKYAVVNLISSGAPPKLSIGCNSESTAVDLVVNARVAIDPTALTSTVTECIASVSAQFGVESTIKALQSFRPGRPEPTYRLAAADNA